jgi:hypothetical protein
MRCNCVDVLYPLFSHAQIFRDEQGENMTRANWVIRIAGAIVILVNAAVSAQAQTAAFSVIDDAVGSRFFEPATTRVDPIDRNRLIIGFNTGLDTALLKYREFRASTAAFSYTSAMDTISVKIAAPAGYYIAKVTYTQRGTGVVLRTGKAAGGTTWTVGDVSRPLGTFGTNPALTGTVNLTGQNRTVVPVSVTTSLFAFATPSLGSASVQVTGADLSVQLLPLP